MHLARVAALAALMLAASPAYAALEDWVLVATSRGVGTHVDRDSIQRVGDRVTLRMKRDEPPTSEYREVIFVRVYDCAAKTSQIMSLESFPKAGGGPVRATFSGEEARPVIPIQPGTLGGIVLDYVCAR